MADPLILASPVELLVWSAPTEAGRTEAEAAVLRALESGASVAELAEELRHRRQHEYRGALVCQDRESAVTALRKGRVLTANRTTRPLAFLLGGVGDHYPGMTARLYASQPVFRDVVDRCCEILSAEGCELRETLCRPPEVAPEPAGDLRAMLRAQPVPQGALSSTRLSQPAVFVVVYALARLLRDWGVRPAAMIGYSLGEYVAACLAGVLSLPDALRLVWWRAQRIEELPPGAMLAVALPPAEASGWLGTELDLAAANSPHQSVLGGPVAAVAAVQRALTAKGIAHRRVGTRHAFHTRMMEPLAGELTAWVRANVRLAEPSVPYLSNVTGNWMTGEQARDPGYWARHLCGTVQLVAGLGVLWAELDPMALELGPGSSLCSFARHHPACGRDRLALVQPTLPATPTEQPESAVLLASLARLWAAGLDVDWARFTNTDKKTVDAGSEL
jgi:acyl transferase domain-containing protein